MRSPFVRTRPVTGTPTGSIRRACLLLLLAAISATWPSCARQASPEIRIGLLALMDGGYTDSSGRPSVRGAQLAEEEINGAGGVRIAGQPYRLRVIVREYVNRPDDAATQARSLINVDSVHVLVGPQLSVHAIPVSVIAEESHVPMISPMSSNPRTTAGKPFVFRLAFLDDFQGEVLGRFARRELGVERAAVLYDEASAYSRDLATRFEASFSGKGGTVVASETYTSDRADDFRPQLSRIAARRPDVLLLPNPSSDDSIQMSQAREMGIEAVFLATDTWDQRHLMGLPFSQGTFVTHQWHYEPATRRTHDFLERFQARYHRTPRTTAAMTYDAVHLIAQAVAAAGSLDPFAVRRSIAAMGDFRGVTGLMRFDGSGDPARSAVISRVEGGTMVMKFVADP